MPHSLQVGCARRAGLFSLGRFNTRVVLAGTTLLGISSGVVGVFMLLRRRSLVGDVVGHAALPGVAIVFLALEARSPGSGRSLPALLAGAFFSGLAGVGLVALIRRATRLKEDAAQAIVLSLFFGVGIALFTVIQSLPRGNAAGLGHFIFGTAATLVPDDVRLIAWAAAASLGLCVVLFKEFALLCFDEDFARSQGWPAGWLDLALMALVAAVTVIGLQTVGLLLMVALLIIPAAAARFWTNRVGALAIVAGLIGGVSAAVGVLVSGAAPKLAAGPTIVLSGSVFFLVSLALGPRGGIVRRAWHHGSVRRRVARHDLLRSLYECAESRIRETQVVAAASPSTPSAGDLQCVDMTEADLAKSRGWPAGEPRGALGRAMAEGIVEATTAGLRLTRSGADEATRVVRNHRLWELYLMAYADVAPSHVDRDADLIEHVLEPDVVRELERQLADQHADPGVPPSPHALPGAPA